MAVNVLTSSPKIWHVKNTDFFQLNWYGSDQWIWQRCCDADLNSVSARLPCSLLKGRPKRYFLDVYLTTLSETVISEIQNRWGQSFFAKYLKFIVNFKNAPGNWEKVFCFWVNCIWIGILKLSLLRTGYFSSAPNVLASSFRIWHMKNRDFFQLNWLGSNQWFW